MKPASNFLILFFFVFGILTVKSQSTKDLTICLQRVIDLNALKDIYTESEKSGETPIIIIKTDQIPENLILFKFGKRVKILTFDEINTFKQFYKGSLDSYFQLKIKPIKEDKIEITGSFRKDNPVKLEVLLVKENDTWVVEKYKVN